MPRLTKGCLLAASLMMAAPVTPGLAAEPIVGSWRAETGNTVQVSPCGGGYCATVVTGEHSGKRIGQLTGSGGSYSGIVTDPSSGRIYEGSATVNGPASSLTLTGCALKIFCRTQTWTRQ